jgi:serine/threonine protein kinase
LIRKGALNEENARKIIKQILSCLNYLHANKIVHRDLKLENILFASEEQSDFTVKLIDFGFSTKYERQTGMDIILGSPLFMAPELVKREIYDERVDIWSLGVLAYVLLSAE